MFTSMNKIKMIKKNTRLHAIIVEKNVNLLFKILQLFVVYLLY